MSMKLGYREIHALTIEAARESAEKGSTPELTKDVLMAGQAKGLISGGKPGFPEAGLSHQDQEESFRLGTGGHLGLPLKRMLMFGMDGSNPNWPFYRLTDTVNPRSELELPSRTIQTDSSPTSTGFAPLRIPR